MTSSELYKIFLECSRQITTDSRNIKEGDIFFALKGENFDGAAFAVQALEQGAAYAVVNEDSEVAKAITGGQTATGAQTSPSDSTTPSVQTINTQSRLITVPDTLKALQQLAAYNREHTLHNGARITMLALTGTNGKTTTKELIKAVLQTKYNLTATEGNFNNNLGVPLTLLRINETTELAIVEMGASHPGDIKELVDIAHPDFGLITNVGRAHLLGFGSFDGVKKTKGELFDYIQSIQGKCFVNEDSEDLRKMTDERKGIIAIPYGQARQKAEILPCSPQQPFLRIRLNGTTIVNTQLVGSYNVSNVLAALAVGKEFGVDEQAAIKAISEYTPSNSRSQMVKTERNTLIVDAYNANPSSMAASIDNFGRMEADNKVLMLGDMLELGNDSIKEHKAIIAKAISISPVLIVLVGGEFDKAADELFITWKTQICNSSIPPLEAEKILRFPDSLKAAEYFSSKPLSGYSILIKGSRGTRMENILKQL